MQDGGEHIEDESTAVHELRNIVRKFLFRFSKFLQFATCDKSRCHAAGFLRLTYKQHIVSDTTGASLDTKDYANLHTVDDDKKLSFVKNRKPHQSFKFPPSVYKDKRKRSGVAKRYCCHD